MPEATQEQVNHFAKKLGLLLVDNGMKFLESVFHLNPVSITGGEVNIILNKYFSLPITHFDNKYNCIDWVTWQDLFVYDWVDTKIWILDYRDCDNFANAFSANMSMFYEINSVGRVYGKFYSGTTFAGYHYWNVIITSDKKIYFFEPSSDKWVKYEGGLLMIGGNKYEPISFVFG